MATKLIQGAPSIQIYCDNSRHIPPTSKCNKILNPPQTGGNVRYNSDKCQREERQIKLGGTNVLVLIDSFPIGYKKFGQDISINHEDRLILGFAEMKNIPPKYHFEFFDNTTHEEDYISQIRRVVDPGSILVIDNSFVGVIEPLKQFYKTVVTVEMLERHNSVDQNVIINLKQVWSNVITACDSAHDIFEVEHILETIYGS